MFVARFGLLAFALAGLTSAAYAQSDPCAAGCAELYKNGCPKNHCAGIIENNTCYPHCSGTFAAPPIVQYYFNGKVFNFNTNSVKPQDVGPK
jgi:hypothetical protein